MRDDPYASRYYPRAEQEPGITSTAVEFPDRFTPLQRFTLRLVLFLVVCYIILAVLMVVSSATYAAPAAMPEIIEPAWDCAGAKLGRM